jgi:hypothetical protein
VSRHAPPHSRPPDRTSTRAFPNSVRLPHSTERSAALAHRPCSPFHERTPLGQTTDARDKELPAPRSGGRYVVELYNETRTHPSLDKDAPVSRAVQTLVTYSPVRPWVDCITNPYGSNLRQAQERRGCAKRGACAARQSPTACGAGRL